MTALRRLGLAALIPALALALAGPAMAAAGGPSAGASSTPTGGRILGDWSRTTNGVTQTITFAKAGKVNGDAGCNRFLGDYGVKGSRIDIGPLASTLMFCEGVMDAEQEYLKALEKATAFRVTGTRLTLFGPRGATLLTFRSS
jgi:heat shock protein HslJ